MGQKTDPRVLRIGIISGWSGKWFRDGKEYAETLKQDILLKKYLKRILKETGLAGIEIQRTPQALTIIVTVARPGIIIGKRGMGAEKLKEELKNKFFSKTNLNFYLNIVEEKNPNLNPNIILNNIAEDLEKRMPYRRAIKHSIDRVMKAGAKGVKVMAAGRLDGVEIARRETLHKGGFPLHTLRADVAYASGAAFTIYGAIGIKVWIYRGEIFK